MVKALIGFLALAIWIIFWHPEWLPLILLIGAVVFVALALLACFCYGVSMLRLFSPALRAYSSSSDSYSVLSCWQ